MTTTIYLIRHGQTEWNVQRRMQGRQDSPLTPQGVEAVERLAADLPPLGILYSSPSGRTLHTARILFGNREILCEDRLREIDLGNWEGRLQADLDRDDPEQHANFWQAPDRYQRYGSETFQQVSDRAVGCLKDLTTRHIGQSIGIVSHTTIIRSMLFSIEPRPLADFWKPPAIYPASLSQIEFCDGEYKIIRFGCTAHHDPDSSHAGAY